MLIEEVTRRRHGAMFLGGLFEPDGMLESSLFEWAVSAVSYASFWQDPNGRVLVCYSGEPVTETYYPDLDTALAAARLRGS